MWWSTLKPETALSHWQLQSHRDVPVNMGGACPCLSMLVHQSSLQVHRFSMDASFFCSELLLALLGIRNWTEEEFLKCKTVYYPFTDCMYGYRMTVRFQNRINRIWQINHIYGAKQQKCVNSGCEGKMGHWTPSAMQLKSLPAYKIDAKDTRDKGKAFHFEIKWYK